MYGRCNGQCAGEISLPIIRSRLICRSVMRRVLFIFLEITLITAMIRGKLHWQTQYGNAITVYYGSSISSVLISERIYEWIILIFCCIQIILAAAHIKKCLYFMLTTFQQVHSSTLHWITTLLIFFAFLYVWRAKRFHCTYVFVRTWSYGWRSRTHVCLFNFFYFSFAWRRRCGYIFSLFFFTVAICMCLCTHILLWNFKSKQNEAHTHDPTRGA